MCSLCLRVRHGARCNRLELVLQATQASPTSVLGLFRVEVTLGVCVCVVGVGWRGNGVDYGQEYIVRTV